jgi:hypothetical protein
LHGAAGVFLQVFGNEVLKLGLFDGLLLFPIEGDKDRFLYLNTFLRNTLASITHILQYLLEIDTLSHRNRCSHADGS